MNLLKMQVLGEQSFILGRFLQKNSVISYNFAIF